MKLATVLLATSGNWLIRLGRQRAGILLLLGALGSGITIGAVGVRWASDFGTHEDRITDVEEWRDAHLRDVTGPGLRDIAANQEALDSIFTRLASLEEMVWELWCPRFPARCEARPLPYSGYGREEIGDP